MAYVFAYPLPELGGLCPELIIAERGNTIFGSFDLLQDGIDGPDVTARFASQQIS